MRIEVDRGAARPPFVQVRDRIARTIERGGLAPGTRLPTVRALADGLELAPNTVARAYRELEEAGYLEGRGRYGTFVADRLPSRPSDAEAKLAEAATAFVRRARQLGFRRAGILAAVRHAVR